MSRAIPATVGQVIKRLRTLVPRMGRRDREIVLDAIEGFEEMAARLHRLEHPEAYQTTSALITVEPPPPTRAPDAPKGATERMLIEERAIAERLRPLDRELVAYARSTDGTRPPGTLAQATAQDDGRGNQAITPNSEDLVPLVDEAVLEESPSVALLPRCRGRYPVPGKRDEPFDVTYRCALRAGHEGPHRGPDEPEDKMDQRLEHPVTAMANMTTVGGRRPSEDVTK